jgi:hypothetical protein
MYENASLHFMDFIPERESGVKHNLKLIFPLFDIPGTLIEASPYGSGHINDTYAVVADQAGTPVRYIFQRINHDIFKDPVKLMDNISRVTTHLAGKLRNYRDASRRTLTVIPSRSGRAYVLDEQGLYWRAYVFIEHARTYDAVESAPQAREAARAFGLFQHFLNDLPMPPLHESIPDFHHTPKRFAALMMAATQDVCGRAASARREIEFFIRRESDFYLLTNLQNDGQIPLRITHNDTKLNNVMLDDETGEGICVIDLDTVMPGLASLRFWRYGPNRHEPFEGRRAGFIPHPHADADVFRPRPGIP